MEQRTHFKPDLPGHASTYLHAVKETIPTGAHWRKKISDATLIPVD